MFDKGEHSDSGSHVSFELIDVECDNDALPTSNGRMQTTTSTIDQMLMLTKSGHAVNEFGHIELEFEQFIVDNDRIRDSDTNLDRNSEENVKLICADSSGSQKKCKCMFSLSEYIFISTFITTPLFFMFSCII